MSLLEQVKKYVTGSTTPTRQRFIEAAVVLAIFLVLGYLIQSFVTKVFLEKADIEATYGALDKDGIGYYFSLNIVNTGQRELSDVYVRFKDCYTKEFMEYKIDKLSPGQPREFRVRGNTVSMYTKKPCSPDYNFSMDDCRIRSYKLNSTHLYVPIQSCFIYMCGLCNYEINITSKSLGKAKVIDKSFYGPKQIELSVTPKKPIEIGNKTFVRELPPIGLNFFSFQEICIMEGHCFVHNIKTSASLPAVPVTLTVCPKENLTCLNATIDYTSTFGLP